MLDPDEPNTHTQNPIEPPRSSTRSAAPAGGQPTSRPAIFGTERTKDREHRRGGRDIARATEGLLRGGSDTES